MTSADRNRSQGRQRADHRIFDMQAGCAGIVFRSRQGVRGHVRTYLQSIASPQS